MKPAAIWWFAFAEAIQHLETFEAFVGANPADFPRLAGSE